MTGSTITIEAILQPDGVTLQLARKLALLPDPIVVTVQAAGPEPGPTMLEVLDRIHGDKRQRGRKAMTDDEMAAEIAQMRAEDDNYEEP